MSIWFPSLRWFRLRNVRRFFAQDDVAINPKTIVDVKNKPVTQLFLQNIAISLTS